MRSTECRSSLIIIIIILKIYDNNNKFIIKSTMRQSSDGGFTARSGLLWVMPALHVPAVWVTGGYWLSF